MPIQINLVPMVDDVIYGYTRNFNIRDRKLNIFVTKAENEIKRIIKEDSLTFRQVNAFYKDRRYLLLLCGRPAAVNSIATFMIEGNFTTSLSPMFDSNRIIAWMPYDLRASAPGYMILRSGSHSFLDHEPRLQKFLGQVLQETG